MYKYGIFAKLYSRSTDNIYEGSGNMPTLEQRRRSRINANDGGIMAGLNPAKASEALADGLRFLKDQWSWNGSKIARVLHLSPTTINGWIRRGTIPVTGRQLSPDVEAVVHLLAVHRNLATMFSEPFHQLQWLTTPHPDLEVAPLNKMSESMAGLIQVRQYLDFVRGRGA
jgi:hypothetical protein